jgi:putative ABC transport system substrate-binding protein
LVTDFGQPEAEITGTCDAWPHQLQLELIHEILPDARILGVIYNPVEPPYQYDIQRMRQMAADVGLDVMEAPSHSPFDIKKAGADLATRVDVLFLASDNFVLDGIESVVKVAIEKKVPLFVGDRGTVQKGGIASISIDYRQLGRDTGNLVHRLISGERHIPVVVASGSKVHLNREGARQMGVVLPDALVERAAEVFDDIE